MHSRRFLLATGLLAPVSSPTTLLAQTRRSALEAEMFRWLDENKSEGYFDPPTPTEDQKGSLILGPSDARVRWAAEKITQIPTNVTPLRAAKWMIDNLNKNDLMEWPKDTPGSRRPANPLIIAFFAKTRTKPVQGDQTAWCAAFANWLLDHVGLPGTDSAGAVSFRGYGQGVDEKRGEQPMPGDIACFVNQDDPRFGHVGFFDGFENGNPNLLRLYGGNQKDRLIMSRFPRNPSPLALDSFRTAPGLRQVRVA